MDTVFDEVHFPACGLDLSRAFAKQTPRPLPTGEYARTTRLGKNVRGYEPAAGRARGGSRPGLERYLDAAPVAGWLVQELALIVWTGEGVQTNSSGRVVTLAAVSQGQVYYVHSGGTSWTRATNATGRPTPLNYSGIVRSTSHSQKLYLVDGINKVVFDPSAATVSDWNVTAGSFPADGDGNLPRLLCTWRGRVVLSGILNDPQNWFMSALGDPLNFDYFPFPVTSTQAVAGNDSPLGLVGDSVTCLVPYKDDLLLVGSDHEIYAIKGDPMAGGQIDQITKSIGMAWGNPWAMDPAGNVYFVSNSPAVYVMPPGQQPQRISQPVEQLLQAYDTGASTIRLIWNDRYQQLHLFFSPTSAPATTTHLCWEQRANAWWTDQFASSDHDPLCCCTFDGNLASDRAALIGSWDGYVRSLSTSAEDDDGYDIASEVVIGPIVTKDLDDILLKGLQAVLGEDSGDVTYAVYVGTSAEAALLTDPVATGTWSAGRNLNTLVRRSGHAVYVKISGTGQWALESVRMAFATQGVVRGRGR